MKTGKNISREKARKSLFNSESAGATVVAAVLLLSIIFTVLVIVRTEYVPMWKNDAEQSHMSEVQKDMAELKSTVDMVSLFTSSDSNTSAHGFPVTVSFSMGGGEIPIMEPSKSSGTLSLNTERCKMTIIPEKASITTSPQIVDCGGITYRSNNREYLDQVFRYENGALIISQKDRSLMRQFPSFEIKRTNGNNYTVSIHAIKITGDPDSVSSNADASLRLTGLYAEPVYDSNDSGGIDSFACAILTEYPDAWISYLNETAKNADLEYGTDYDLYKVSSDTVYFSFPINANKTLERLDVSKSVIQAELGTGSSLKYDSYGTGGGSLPGGSENVMELGKWYTFELSDNRTAILPLKDNKTGFVFPASSGTNIKLENYANKDYVPNAFEYPMTTSFEDVFRFNSFTDFSSKPNSATIRMIYKLDYTSPSVTMNVAGNKPGDGVLIGNNNGKEWYLYNETTLINITDPSDLTYYLKINKQNVKKLNIDYLTVRLD